MNKLYRLAESTKDAAPEHFVNFVKSTIDYRIECSRSDKLVLETFSLDNDYVMAVAVTVSAECGFRLESSGPGGTFDLGYLRRMRNVIKWRDCERKAYQISLYLPDIQDYKFYLVGVPFVDSLLVLNLLTVKHGRVLRDKSLSLMPRQWLSLFQTNVAERFLNLPNLARTLKDFFQSGKDLVLNAENQPNPSLLGLGEDLKLKIFQYLPMKDFINITSTCSNLRSFSNSATYWKYRLKRDFNVDSDNPMDDYISKYCTNKVVVPSYPTFPEEVFPVMLHNQATSSTTISLLLPF